MKPHNKHISLALTATLVLVAANVPSSPVFAKEAEKPTIAVDFSGDTVGGEPKTFAPVVGHWMISADQDKKVFTVDGSKWKEGQASATLADKARALYGDRYAEFLDNVKKYAYFPLAVYKDLDDFKAGEISVRFKPIAGHIDQGAGIVFNLKANGDYLVIRANALENNLVLFKYEHGKRSPVKWIRNTPTPTRQWHDLKVVIQGTSVKGYLDGKPYLEDQLKAPVSGKIGLWSKADSVMHFSDFHVKPEN
ncbi:MAG: hypothetical protein IPP97_04165 [Candidatus Obscuribacter sp.]|nr:hypothetical protein [Candidatus Obscuribacter sp.]